MKELLSGDDKTMINVPNNLKYIVRRISEILKIDEITLSDITFKNSNTVYKNILM